MYDGEIALEYAKLVIPAAAALVGAVAKLLGTPSGRQGDLTRLQRLFLWFPPATPRAYAAHGLAWGSLLGGLISILLLKSSGSEAPDTYADLIVLTLFLTLTFRGWALAERRWNDPMAIPNVVPILRKPAN